VLAFLAGADLDFNVFRAKWKKSTAVGLIGFFSSACGASSGARVLEGLRDLCMPLRPVAARPTRLLAGSRPFVPKKRIAPHGPKGHICFGRCCADSSKNEDRVRSPQAGLENVKSEPGGMFTSARHRWSNRPSFPGGRKQKR